MRPGHDHRRRPVIAVVATPGSTDRVRSLVRQLAMQADIRALDAIDGHPDGVLVASVDALDAVPLTLPIAVWVTDAEELTVLGGSGRDARVVLSADRGAVAAGAIAVPVDPVDTEALRFMPPLVRSRVRERDGLPAALVVTIDPDTEPTGGAVTALALAAAAVVTGPMLATALALGTPTVTIMADARRLGLRPRVEVEIAEPDAAHARARAIAADGEWAARLSFAARRFAETVLDLGPIADAVLDKLGPAPSSTGPLDPQARMQRRLAELATPSTAPIRRRAAGATACFAPSVDRS